MAKKSLPAIGQPTYVFHLLGTVKPKARPRCFCERSQPKTRTPQAYINWKNAAKRQLKTEALLMGIRSPVAHKVRFFAWFFGKHYRGSDYIDNAPGAIADALVDAKAWANDNGNNGVASNYQLFWSDDLPEVYIALAPCIETTPRGAVIEAQAQALELWDYIEKDKAQAA